MDIVEELGQHERYCPLADKPTFRKAADEIERLREKLRIAEVGLEAVRQPPPYVFTRDIAAETLAKLRK